MKTVRRLSRRSFLGRVVGGAAVGGSALLMVGGQAEAFQISDSDSGPNSDPPGRGRGSRVSDTDPVDPSGNGRGPRHATCTDAGEHAVDLVRVEHAVPIRCPRPHPSV